MVNLAYANMLNSTILLHCQEGEVFEKQPNSEGGQKNKNLKRGAKIKQGRRAALTLVKLSTGGETSKS